MLKSISKKRLVGIALVALLFAFSCVVPFYANEALASRGQGLLMGLGIFALFVVIAIPVDRKLSQSSITTTQEAFGNPRRVFIVCFAIFELVFLFALLSNYPGYCSNDTNDLVKVVLGQPVHSESYRYDGLSNHHPVLYTLCMWIVFTLTAPLNSTMLSVAVFIFIQMTYLAFALATAVAWLDKTKAAKTLTVFVVAFLALSPVLLSHAITAWKDIPFSATIILLVVFLAQLDLEKKLDAKQIVKLSALFVLVTLFRNNGIFVTAAALVYLIVVYKPARKACCGITAGIAVFSALLNGPVFSALSVQPGHFVESVGIPVQQIAATVESGADIPEGDREVLEGVLPLETWAGAYYSSTPNTIKYLPEFNDEYLNSHKLEFLGVWFHLLPGNLGTYAKAWVLETYSYWQPGFTTQIGHPETLDKGQPQDLLGLGFNPYQIGELLRPYLPILLGSGALIWVVLLLLYLSLMTRKEQKWTAVLLPFIPLLALYATVLIAAPTLHDYRYVLALYLAIPFLCNLVGMREAWERSKY